MILVEAAVDSPADRQRLIGVCFQWKEVLYNTPSLWTTLSLCTYYPNDEQLRQLFDNLSSRLSRCGSLMLEVKLNLVGLQETHKASLFALLSEKAPFTRWRSLELWEREDRLLTPSMLKNMGDFRNLERLDVCAIMTGQLLKMASESATSKLGELAIRSWIHPDQFEADINGLLKYIRRLELSEQYPSIKLPANIVELTMSKFPPMPLPYIKILTFTSRQSVTDLSDVAFPNLTSLTVSFLPIPWDVRAPSIRLSNVESLTVYGSEFGALAYLSLPKLRRLAMRDPPSLSKHPWGIDSLVDALLRNEFSLSPSEELDLGFPVHSGTLNLAAKKMSRVKKVVMNLEDVKQDWVEVVASLTNANMDLRSKGSGLLTNYLVLKSNNELDESDTLRIAKKVMMKLAKTRTTTLKILPNGSRGVVVTRDNVSR
ncbi:hypothetical protein PIIN_10703 [Serendipita indica DSM 11827]|uniref:F-box domain-containing protein n=1 Tax=Serendipita indica (strain DSM 11827) TaxID=1109443 RepID=G4TZH2_SERID|nr:hypothetical protein PIIN_10703 [Serendipita indica DSM 11827]